MSLLIAHDYLTQRGGAERVALQLAKAFPGSSILTSVYDPDGTFPQFRDLDVQTLGLERVPVVRRDPRLALPVLADLFRRHEADADVVLCSSSGFAHLVRSRGPKVVYCHNPPRWLYQWEDYRMRLPRPAQLAMHGLRERLLHLDRLGAREATMYIANSRNSAGRVRAAYGRDAHVVHPPRGLDPAGLQAPVPGLEPGYLLTVGRPRGYKRTDLLLDAVAGMPEVRLVTVGCHPEPRWPANIRQLVDVPDEQLRWLYAHARALLVCSHEDFGLCPVEAFGFGLPVGASQEGGYLETCVEGLTGLWLDCSSLPALRQSIQELLRRPWDADAIRRHGERWTSTVFGNEIRATVARAAGTPLEDGAEPVVLPVPRRHPTAGWLRPLTEQRAPAAADATSGSGVPAPRRAHP